MNEKTLQIDKIMNYCTGSKPQQLVNIFVLMDAEKKEVYRKEVRIPNPHGFKHQSLVISSMSEKTFTALINVLKVLGYSENEISITDKDYSRAGVAVK